MYLNLLPLNHLLLFQLFQKLKVFQVLFFFIFQVFQKLLDVERLPFHPLPPTYAPVIVDTKAINIQHIDPYIFASQMAMIQQTAGFAAQCSNKLETVSVKDDEWISRWKCQWCCKDGIHTPTIRRGPLGNRTVCNSCGIFYENNAYLPDDRYNLYSKK